MSHSVWVLSDEHLTNPLMQVHQVDGRLVLVLPTVPESKVADMIAAVASAVERELSKGTGVLS